MRRFHTSIPWLGEPKTIISEEITVLPPYVGETILLSGGRQMRVTGVSVATRGLDAYRRRSFWTVQIEVEPAA